MSLTVLADYLGSQVNALLGLYVPIITTPVELLNWEEASDDAGQSP